MAGDENGADVTAIVESIRRKIERRVANRPRTPPFDPKLAADAVRMRQAAELYQAPLASGRGVAASATAFVRKGLRRLLLPWVVRQTDYNLTSAHAVDTLRDQMELLAYHQALATEDLLDAQSRSLDALRGQWEAAVSSLMRGIEAVETEEIATRGAVGALRTDHETLRAEFEALQSRVTSVRANQQAVSDQARASTEQLTAAFGAELQSLRERVARAERRLRRLGEPISASSALGVAGGPEQPVADLSPFDYAGFEERFRGSEDDIRERQRAYLPYFTGAQRVVDLGCGRGEFLELMRDAGIEAEGIEIDTDMALCCRDKGLRVTRGELFEWLDQQQDGSLGGVFSAQVIEHLPPDRVIRLVALTHRKLRPGGRLILETVNPASLAALASFFLDFTHVRPLHPEAMRFLLESQGFSNVEIRFSGTLDPSVHVPEVPESLGASEVARLFNPAIRRLNGLVYGPFDYAVIGRNLDPNVA
jgi:O-antigen chain-terminating methyltransferase